MKKYTGTLIFILLAILGRILPHPPNVTPFTAIAIYSGINLRGFQAFFSILVAYLISNCFIAYVYDLAFWGNWLVFTTTGYMGIVYITIKWLPPRAPLLFAGYILIISLLYWLWSNLGTWLLSGMYPLNFEGFIACYTMALPFLSYSLLGDLFWTLVIFNGLKLLPRTKVLG